MKCKLYEKKSPKRNIDQVTDVVNGTRNVARVKKISGLI